MKRNQCQSSISITALSSRILSSASIFDPFISLASFVLLPFLSAVFLRNVSNAVRSGSMKFSNSISSNAENTLSDDSDLCFCFRAADAVDDVK